MVFVTDVFLTTVRSVTSIYLCWASDGCQTRTCSLYSKCVHRKGTREQIYWCASAFLWYKCVPTSLLYFLIYTFPTQFKVVLLQKAQSVQTSFCTLSFLLVLEEGSCSASHFFILFFIPLKTLSYFFYFIKPLLLHSINTTFPQMYRLGGFYLQNVEFLNSGVEMSFFLFAWSQPNFMYFWIFNPHIK